MTKSLKSQNTPRLWLVFAANILLFLVIIFGVEILDIERLRIRGGSFGLVPFGLGIIFVGLINAVIGPLTKARIVFFRWKHPLPGSEAFSKYVHEDHRTDIVELNKWYGPLPDDPDRQNRLWYKLYKQFEEEPSVSQAHKEYLFTRDYAALALYLLAGFGGAGFLILDSFVFACGYFILLVLQFFIALKAARTHGKSFVTNVLALASAGKGNLSG
jgi:hypothetical protein